jgi:NitT/TauT family transport system substrate-binding protein
MLLTARSAALGWIVGASLLVGCAAPAPQPTGTAPATAPAAAPSIVSAPAPVAAAPPAAPTKVRVGATWTSFTQMPFLYAEEKGYFREAGVEMDRETIGSSDQMIAPLGTGQLEVGASGFGAGLFNAVSRNISFKIVADNGQSVGTSSGALVARKELLDSGRLRDYADLRGLKVAMAGRGTGLNITLERALEKGGLTLDDIEVADLRFADMTPALANGAVDAALHVEPGVTLGVEQGTFGVFKWMDEIYPDQQFNAVLYSPQFAASGDPAQRFMVAYVRGVRDYNEVIRKGRNMDEFAAIGAKYLGVKDLSLYPKMRNIGMNPDGYLNRQGVADDLSWYRAQGLVQQPVDLDAIIDYSFVDAAVRQLGPYQ